MNEFHARGHTVSTPECALCALRTVYTPKALCKELGAPPIWWGLQGAWRTSLAVCLLDSVCEEPRKVQQQEEERSLARIRFTSHASRLCKELRVP